MNGKAQNIPTVSKNEGDEESLTSPLGEFPLTEQALGELLRTTGSTVFPRDPNSATVSCRIDRIAELQGGESTEYLELKEGKWNSGNDSDFRQCDQSETTGISSQSNAESPPSEGIQVVGTDPPPLFGVANKELVVLADHSDYYTRFSNFVRSRTLSTLIWVSCRLSDLIQKI